MFERGVAAVQSRLLVVGSLNMDLVMRVERLPRPGETVKSLAFQTHGGGKGANQAVAAARLGATVAMIGAVGRDDYGGRLLGVLRQDGVDVTHVRQLEDTPTGTAMIVVDVRGQNQIVIVPGANDAITFDQLQRGFAAKRDAAVCLLQLEIPMEMVKAAAKMAKEAGMTVVLDPAPAAPLADDLLRYVDVITPNETETFVLTGVEVTDPRSAERAARVLLDRGVGAAVIKMGAQGAFLHHGAATYYKPAIPVEAVDTTAAGDAFNGSFSVAISRGDTLAEAVDYAVAVGALTVTRAGAIPSLPTSGEVSRFLAERA